MIEPSLLEILACPACETRPPLRQDRDELKCDLCGRAFPIVDGVPNLLVEDGGE